MATGSTEEAQLGDDAPSPDAAEPDPPTRPGPPRWGRLAFEGAAVLVVWMGGAAVFFRAQLASGFNHLMGDPHDSRYIVYLMENWFQVFHGHGTWRNVPYFYPVKDVLGESDAFFLYEVFYTPLRLLGFDQYVAAQLTIVLLSLVGFVSFVYLVRLLFRTPLWIAMAVGLVFTFANNLWLHQLWYQLFGVWLVPTILLLAVLAGRVAGAHPRVALVLGAGAGLMGGLLFLSTYYVAWFSALALGVVFVLALIIGRRRMIVRIVDNLRQRWWLAVTAAVAFGVGLVPFALTYLPATHRITHVPYSQVMLHAAGPADVLNVGLGNTMWTTTLHSALPSVKFWADALDYSVGPLLMALSLLGPLLVVVLAWRRRYQLPSGGVVLLVALAASSLVLYALTLRFSTGSLWAVMWHIPGATALRRIARIGVVIGLIACLALAGAATYLLRMSKPGRDRWILTGVIGAVLVACVVEQLNTSPQDGLNRPAQLAVLRSAPRPPSGCRSFYVFDTAHLTLNAATQLGFDTGVADNIDALQISTKYSLPTINGYVYAPKGWNLEHPYTTGYLAAVTSWADSNHIEAGLCELDLGTMTWHPYPVRVQPLAVRAAGRRRPVHVAATKGRLVRA